MDYANFDSYIYIFFYETYYKTLYVRNFTSPYAYKRKEKRPIIETHTFFRDSKYFRSQFSHFTQHTSIKKHSLSDLHTKALMYTNRKNVPAAQNH